MQTRVRTDPRLFQSAKHSCVWYMTKSNKSMMCRSAKPWNTEVFPLAGYCGVMTVRR